MSDGVRSATIVGTTARRAALALALAGALAAGLAACSSDDDDGGDSGGAGQSGSAGYGASGAGAAAGRSDSDGGGSGTAAAGASGAAAGTGGASGAGSGENADGGSAFPNTGVCGQRGESTVNASSFSGFEEYYLISDRGFGDDICVVRFDVMRVGEAAAGCDDPVAGVDCLWTHLVEFSNPTVMTDEDGVCGDSELGLDDARIAEIDGSRASYGFVSEFAGHNSVVMKYDDETDTWGAYGNGTYDEDAEAFRFDRRDGLCDY